MSFISYAQNFEDVMLMRALKHIENGFYIDVGANDPVIDSVTKTFYDKGWSGINIEPVNEWFVKLIEQRPRDINLQVAASDAAGEVTFYEIPNTGLSTANPNIARQHHEEDQYGQIETTVKRQTLTDICQQHSVNTVHFLKIDVEGHELEVLKGLDLNMIRPWIILVESTLPSTQIPSHQAWEYLLTEQDYHFVYFDGLSRFYIAGEHSQLQSAFSVPPNVFDEFYNEKEFALKQNYDQLMVKTNDLFKQLELMKNSTSWKITRPLRRLKQWMNRLFCLHKQSLSPDKTQFNNSANKGNS